MSTKFDSIAKYLVMVMAAFAVIMGMLYFAQETDLTASSSTANTAPERDTENVLAQGASIDAVDADPITEGKRFAAYADALAADWLDWSWNTSVDFQSDAAVYEQSGQAIAVTFNEAWAALYLHSNNTILSNDYDRLRFQIHGGSQGDQAVRVVLADENQALQKEGVNITAQADEWTAIEIDLADLGNVTHISGIAWQDATGSAQPTFFIDQIEFVDLDLPPTPVPVAVAGPALQVDASEPGHAISPYIYGINYADEALAEAINLPVRRWGGNGTTRYNWQLDTANHTINWFFENIAKDNPARDQLPNSALVNQFIEQNLRTETETILTLPMIGWTPKSVERTCGFSVAKYGPQQKTDPWMPDCGNGIYPDGRPIIDNDPTDTSRVIGPDFVEEWMQYLVARYGTASEGGIAFYNLDNEPMLWHETHRDVHPEPVSYDELLERTLAYAPVIKRTDPTAKTLGPTLWGWWAYFHSAKDEVSGNVLNTHPDRKAHDDLALVPWYLQQMAAYEQEHGVRLLDYLDLHYYPQAAGVTLAPVGDVAIQDQRLRSTRTLWDKDYVDESWINEPVYLIPRMRAWVDQYYPDTKLAITEYNWGGLEHINGAVAQADVLGIFGREGLDMATLWDPLEADKPFAFAFRMYRNYDGTGNTFGDISLEASSTDQDKLSIYAAQRSQDNAITIIVLNKSRDALISDITILGTNLATEAQVYQYSAHNLNEIEQLPNQRITDGSLKTTFPATSITLFVLPSTDAASTPLAKKH